MLQSTGAFRQTQHQCLTIELLRFIRFPHTGALLQPFYLYQQESELKQFIREGDCELVAVAHSLWGVLSELVGVHRSYRLGTNLW